MSRLFHIYTIHGDFELCAVTMATYEIEILTPYGWRADPDYLGAMMTTTANGRPKLQHRPLSTSRLLLLALIAQNYASRRLGPLGRWTHSISHWAAPRPQL